MQVDILAQWPLSRHSQEPVDPKLDQLFIYHTGFRRSVRICCKRLAYIDDVLALIPLHCIRTCASRLMRDSHRIDIPSCPDNIHLFLKNVLRRWTSARNDKHPTTTTTHEIEES